MRKLKKNAKKGYKIVYSEDEKLRSISVYSAVKYAKKKKTRRPLGDGPLAVFDELYFAKKFKNRPIFNDIRLEVWECVYIPSKDRTLWYSSKGWKQVEMKDGFPTGTDFADMVKLIKKID